MVLRQWDCIIGAKDRLHDISITGNLLLIARRKRADPDIRQQRLDLTVGELGAFDAGRRTDAFNGRNTTQTGQTFRCNPPDRSPCSLEFIDLRDQRQYLRRNAQR